MTPKEKIISMLLVIPATIAFTLVFIVLRFGLALSFILVQNIISDSVLNILFWVVQGIVAIGLVIYLVIKRRFALVVAVTLGFIFSFGFGPMD